MRCLPFVSFVPFARHPSEMGERMDRKSQKPGTTDTP